MDTEPPSLLLFALIQWSFIFGIILLFVLLICTALINGAELAFFSLDSNQVKSLEDDESHASQRVLALRDKPRRLLATILMSSTLTNIGVILTSFSIVNVLLPEYLMNYWGSTIAQISFFSFWPSDLWGSAIKVLINIAAISFLLVLFGEVLPKTYANLNSIAFARRMSGPLQFLMTLLAPANKAIVRLGINIDNKLRPENTLGANKDDIDKAIDLAVAKDEDNVMEAGILKSIVGFNEVAVKQIMRSRMDMHVLDTSMNKQEMLEMVRESGYSRYPVYEENLDNLKGILYAKDLLAFVQNGEDTEWPSLVREEILYVPEARKINELLKDFQREHLHMAIVVDEYGGTSGLVTLEDVIEEVIGDIRDEFDEDTDVEYRKLGDREFNFEGKTMLIDVLRIMELDKTTFERDDSEADSLAGLMLELNGKMPVVGQRIHFPPFTFTILSVSAKRIERVKVQYE